MQTIAAVDMGSNAIRIHIANLLTTDNSYEFKSLEYIRIPLRLGEDVFSKGEISLEKQDKLHKLAQSLIYLFELFNVSRYYCCATSAMREATNNQFVIDSIKQKTNFYIQVIDGVREAELTNFGLQKYLGNGTWVHVDVGGGSTEINIYENKVKIASRSFRIGAVRMLMMENIEEEWKSMDVWVSENIQSKKEVYAIGTGGNIGKIHQMANIEDNHSISALKIQEIVDLVSGYSTQDRINILKLNPDRADVILPSAQIYLYAMKVSNAKEMYAPKIGLTDGILEFLKNNP